MGWKGKIGVPTGDPKLDKYDYPITIVWSEPDGEMIATAEQLERA